MTAMSGKCPKREECGFFTSVSASPMLRIKYATMYPYCNAGRHESCMRWWMMQEGKPVPEDLLPDGGHDWFSSEANRSTASGKRRVLVVDDLPLFRVVLSGLVRDVGGTDVEVVEAESGERALEILGANTEDWTAVITDYNMGGMSGFDLIMTMRANPAHAQLPAIVFSSDADDAKRDKCEALPRVRWLDKRPDREPFAGAWQEIIAERKV